MREQIVERALKMFSIQGIQKKLHKKKKHLIKN